MLSQVGFASQQSDKVHVEVAHVILPEDAFKWCVPSTQYKEGIEY